VGVGSDQRNDRSAALPQLAQDSKSIREVAHVEIIPETRRRSQVSRLTVECAAAQHPQPTLAGGPRRSVRRGATIVVVPAVLDPFGHVARAVVETERAWLERSDRCRFWAAARSAIPTVGLAGAELAPPPEGCGGAGAGGIFPLGLGRQPIGLPGFLGEPIQVRLGVGPADIDDGPIASSPTAIIGSMLAASGVDATIPFVERHLVAADGKRFGDGHPMDRVLEFGGGAHVE